MNAEVHDIRDARPRTVPGKGQVPPHDPHAERALIATVFLEPTTIDQVASIITTGDFWSRDLGIIYGAAVELSEQGRETGPADIAGHLRDRNLLGEVGGAEALARLCEATQVSGQPEALAKRLRALARVRRTIESLQTLTSTAYATTAEGAQEFLDRAASDIATCAQRPEEEKRIVWVRDLLREVTTTISERASRGETMTGMETGFARLDQTLAGWQRGDLTIIAGRPSMGKTAFAMQTAVNVAHKSGPVLVFSLEQPKIQLGERMLCSEARVELQKLRLGELQANDWHQMTEIGRWLAEQPLYIDDTTNLSHLDIRMRTRRFSRELERAGHPPVSAIVVDYLQLMKHVGRPNDNEEQLIARTSKGLKSIAKELDVAVLALAQLNRDVEKRPNKRPNMSDLRGSGSLEQDADAIVFLYRDAYYLKERCPENRRNIAEAIIAKQRNGPCKTVFLGFYASCAMFGELDADAYRELMEDE